MNSSHELVAGVTLAKELRGFGQAGLVGPSRPKLQVTLTVREGCYIQTVSQNSSILTAKGFLAN